MRTDDDTWDITTSVGATALFVAAARALEARKPEPLVVDRYAELFCRAVGGHWAEIVDGTATDSTLDTDFGTHFVDFQAARSRYLDDYCADAVADGVRQFVILAAGLDSRAYRLSWPDGTVIYELDQPQVLEFKRQVLGERGDVPRAQRREVAVDLREDWPAALRGSGFDASEPVAFIVEGLMIYLPAAAQGDLLAGIHALSCSGSHIALEEGEPLPEAAFQAAKAAELASSQTDRNFFSLIYNQRYAKADDWFEGRGWVAERTQLGDQLVRLGRPLPAAGSESAFMVAGNSLIKAKKG